MIVVTGASGFIGLHLTADLQAAGIAVCPVVRPGSRAGPGAVTARLDRADDWPAVLEGASAVVHLAVHNPGPGSRRGDAEAFRRVNVEGTALLAEQAAKAGVGRFVFTSSIRFYGDGSHEPFTEDLPCGAGDPYGNSKCEAEAALKQALAGTDTAWTILRPPVVYGAGRGGAVRILDRLVRNGLPVPVPRRGARRSLTYVGNLVSGIRACLADERSRTMIFNISDGRPFSYGELTELIAEAHGRKAQLVPLPENLFGLAGSLPGAGRLARLVAPCVCDDTLIRKTIGWVPPYSTLEGLRLSYVGR
jgi:nucleoside-diphosphate-sugar epimerase